MEKLFKLVVSAGFCAAAGWGIAQVPKFNDGWGIISGIVLFVILALMVITE